MAAKKSAKGSGAEFLEMNIRFKQDGGPVFPYLNSIADPYARGERVRHLIYLGLMVEQGRVVAGGRVDSIPSPVFPLPSPTLDRRDTTPEPKPELAYDKDDLSAIFGGGEAQIGG